MHIVWDANNVCPNLTLFFPNNLQIANLNVKTKTYHCKQIKVPVCLVVLVVIAQKHFTASTICCLQKLGFVGIVDYHYIFLILNISYTNQIWMRLFQLAQIWFGLLEFTRMFTIYANLNEPFLIYPDVSNRGQVWMKPLQLPKLFDASGIDTNVSNCIQISMKLSYSILRKLNESIWSCPKFIKVVWSYLKLNEGIGSKLN